MKLSDLDYPLPKEKIALFPTQDRPAAKLLCVDRASGACSHKIFRDLPELLKPTDLLVLNNTKVLPARLFGEKMTGGKIEALLLKELDGNIWEALLKPGGRIKNNDRLVFFDRRKEIAAVPPSEVPRNDVIARRQNADEAISLVGIVVDSTIPHSGKRCIRFEGEDVAKRLHTLGHIPLPPYINRPDLPADRETYQTVYAEKEGAVAAPTAGLHFDEALLNEIRKKGVEIVSVTLHVSYGTFQPITVEPIEEHQMFEEEFEISAEAAHKINAAKRAGRRVIVCGTTCVRALESAIDPFETRSSPPQIVGRIRPLAEKLKTGSQRGVLQAGKSSTSIFIHPPYDFKIVDALITNFHMPKSTLLAMVAAFLGYEKLMAAYNTALKENYRFASYGDAMFIA